jgi:hypothetical protein
MRMQDFVDVILHRFSGFGIKREVKRVDLVQQLTTLPM